MPVDFQAEAKNASLTAIALRLPMGRAPAVHNHLHLSHDPTDIAVLERVLAPFEVEIYTSLVPGFFITPQKAGEAAIALAEAEDDFYDFKRSAERLIAHLAHASEADVSHLIQDTRYL